MVAYPRLAVVLTFAFAFAGTACTHFGSRSPKDRLVSTSGVEAVGTPAYQTIETTFTSVAPVPIGSCALGATILKPTKPRALVVLIHGSGPTNRDELAAGHRPFKDLAERLASAGYATVRFDKRAAIPGCAEKLTEWLRADHFLRDVVEVANQAAARPELAGLPLVLLGHSEGVTYANEITARGWLQPAALVLISGLGRYPLDATLLRQLRDQVTMPAIPDADRRKVEALLKEGETFFLHVREGTARPNERYYGAYAAFWGDMIAMTEQATITAAQVRVPSLVLWGNADKNVTAEDFESLKTALAKTPHARAQEIDGVSHLLSKGDDTTVATELSDAVVAWLDELPWGDLKQPAKPGDGA